MIERFRALPTATISDALRRLGAPHQVLHHELHNFGQTGRFAAPAFCVRGERVLGTIEARHDRRFELYEIFPEGAALVLDSGGYSGAVCFGENVALSLKMRGCTGIVTDGPIRDRNAMVDLGLPVYASYVTPLSSGRQWVMLELDVSVTLRGESTRAVPVHTGDVIVGDDDGVVIIPRDLADAVCTAAEKAMAAEERVRQRILNGESPKSAYAAEPRY